MQKSLNTDSTASRAELGAARRAKPNVKKFLLVLRGTTYFAMFENITKTKSELFRLAVARRFVLSANLDPPPRFTDKYETGFIKSEKRICGFCIFRISKKITGVNEVGENYAILR